MADKTIFRDLSQFIEESKVEVKPLVQRQENYVRKPIDFKLYQPI